MFSSTAATYGEPAKQPIEETAPNQPTNPYGQSKLAFEQAMRWYREAYSLRFAALRYFNAAGASENCGEDHAEETHIIPIALQAAAGKRDFVEVYGDDYPTADGTCVRDYIHVTDLAEAHVLALEYLTDRNSAALNLGTGRGHSVREVLSMIKHVTGREVPSRLAPPRPGDPPELVADPTRAEKLLNWKAKRSLEDIVATAWRWAEHTQNELRPS